LEETREKLLPFFLEIVTYHNDNSILQDSNLVIESVRKFLDRKLIPEVFKLEYPGSEEACKKVTFLLEKTPWILLTRGENFEVFKSQLRTAVISGASGFLAGRALWQEIGKYKNQRERSKYLKNIVKKRFQEISEVVMKNTFIA
jgi:tagatose-1,6-bisphosphate aldolase